jgi:hypothetical protein
MLVVRSWKLPMLLPSQTKIWMFHTLIIDVHSIFLATINEVQVRRALVDTGSCINLVPLSTLRAAEIS